MSIAVPAGLGGIGFVVVGLTVNALYFRIRLPLPASGQTPDQVADAFATIGDALRRPSVPIAVTWLCTTVFAAGVFSQTWQGGTGSGPWALVGFAGVLLQNATFTVVEALRFAVAAAAAHDRRSVPGLWALTSALFGFNQVFLATALLGFTISGTGAGLVPDWHAWLGYASAALLFISSLATPYTVDRRSRTSAFGLVGWLGWVVWIVVYSITLLRT
jgi:hypothetical protein